MASITFRITSKKNPANIYLRLRQVGKKEIHAKTPYKIDPDNWDYKNATPKLSKRKASLKQLSFHLHELREKIGNALIDASENDAFDKQTIERLIKAKPTNEIEKESNDQLFRLVNYFDYYIKTKKGEVTESTIKKYRVIKQQVISFQKAKNETLFIPKVGPSTAQRFKAYLRENGYAESTIQKAFKFIKTICLHANRFNNIPIHDGLHSIKAKKVHTRFIYLSRDEIMKVYNFNYSSSRLQHAMEWLVISCLTGQRVSDLERLKNGNIVKKGNEWTVDIIQQKTKKMVTVPLVKEVQEIIKRNNGNFPNLVSDVKLNLYVKEGCKCAGLDEEVYGGKLDPKTKRKKEGIYPKHELVTMHIGRRSFCTNSYNDLRTSIQVIMNISGHESERQFMEYIGKKDRALVSQFFESYEKYYNQ